MKNQIAILILFYNKLEETIACIESFLPSYQPVYVLNNGSDARLWKRLQAQFGCISQVTFLHSDVNLGISAGRNLLIQRTRELWLLIVDNDVRMKNPSDWVSRFDNLVAQHPVYKVFTLHIYNVHEKADAKPVRIEKKDYRITIESCDEMVTNCFPCTGTILHRSIFETYGLFDESLFVFEDFEYGIRCLHTPEGELSVLHVAEIELIHDHRFQHQNVNKKAIRERYNEQRIRESCCHIEKKYNIKFDHHWEWWTRKQVKEMAGRSLATRIKESIGKRLSLR